MKELWQKEQTFVIMLNFYNKAYFSAEERGKVNFFIIDKTPCKFQKNVVYYISINLYFGGNHGNLK